MHLTRFIQASASVLLLCSAVGAAPTNSSCTNTLQYFTTRDGARYAYHYHPPQGSNQTFLLLHGYPSWHRDWDTQVAALTAEGFGTLAPDLLGYGSSDKPTDHQAYNGKRIAGHLNELIDHAGLETVIGVAHDFGAMVLSRVAVYHPDRFDKFVFLSVGYRAPGGFFDVDALNAAGLAQIGYMPFGYWYFLWRYDAAAVLRDHLDSFWNLAWPVNTSLWSTQISPLGAARAWLTADTITPDPPYMEPGYKEEWKAWISQPNAMESTLQFHKGHLFGVDDGDDSLLSEEDWMIHVPVLTIGGLNDTTSRPEFMRATERWTAAGYRHVDLEGGHWLTHERSSEVSALLLEFAKE
ncbi:Alpha/Beta hydrolase protein [Stachybotrys elegans]|uniref:Alpha/Beta hydrolase protein n=1 Tax=Stachybotrys elegans TaxID=80388 RepID=A0A8K0T0Y3_9HYPO|nr:Alpha/Beta hydrolase protein [Stachybotrys elegans]